MADRQINLPNFNSYLPSQYTNILPSSYSGELRSPLPNEPSPTYKDPVFGLNYGDLLNYKNVSPNLEPFMGFDDYLDLRRKDELKQFSPFKYANKDAGDESNEGIVITPPSTPITPSTEKSADTTKNQQLSTGTGLITPPESESADKVISTRAPELSTRTKPSMDYVKEQESIIRDLLSGTSPEEEAIVATLDPARMGLMAEFAGIGATGAGALQSMMLKQAADVGSQVAQVRDKNRQEAFNRLIQMREQGRADEASDLAEKYFGITKDKFTEIELPESQARIDQIKTSTRLLKDNAQWNRYMDILTNPNLAPEEAGRITGLMGQALGIDFSTIPKETARKMYETSTLEYLDWTREGDRIVDATGKDVTDKFNTIVNNWAQGQLGLTEEFEPAVTIGGTYADYSADPFGTDTQQAVVDWKSGDDDAAIRAVTDEIVATGDYNKIKDWDKGTEGQKKIYNDVVSKLDKPNLNTDTGLGGDDFWTSPPAVGDYVQISGRPMKVTFVGNMDRSGSLIDYAYMEAEDLYGNVWSIKTGDKDWFPQSQADMFNLDTGIWE